MVSNNVLISSNKLGEDSRCRPSLNRLCVGCNITIGQVLRIPWEIIANERAVYIPCNILPRSPILSVVIYMQIMQSETIFCIIPMDLFEQNGFFGVNDVSCFATKNDGV